MLTEICNEIKNWFSSDKDIMFGDFSIVDGHISPPIQMQNNQYYRIIGSLLNDGVHREDDYLMDEESFNGAIWLMKIPKEILVLNDEIEEWQAKYCGIDSPAMSPYNSESFGGYSYTKSGHQSSDNSSDNECSWQSIFASRLNPYRKIRAI